MGQNLSKQAKAAARVIPKDATKGTQMGGSAPPPAGQQQQAVVSSTIGRENLFKHRDAQQAHFLKQQQQQNLPPPPRPPLASAANTSTISSVPTKQQQQQQQQQLRFQQQQQQQQDSNEMPPDLLQFLKDVGPLDKKVVKDQTSPRLVEALSSAEQDDTNEANRMTEKQLNLDAEKRRERRDMRLVGSIEGFTTTKTTNFDTRPTVQDEKDFGLLDTDIYTLLTKYQQYNNNNTDSEGKVPSAAAAVETLNSNGKFLESFYDEHLKTNFNSGSGSGCNNGDSDSVMIWTREEQSSHQELLKNTLDYIGIPVLVKENRDEYVGVWEEHINSNDNEVIKLDIVDESRVKLLLADTIEKSRSRFEKISSRRKKRQQLQQQNEDKP